MEEKASTKKLYPATKNYIILVMNDYELIPFETIVGDCRKPVDDKHRFGNAVFRMNEELFGASTGKKPSREIEPEDITHEVLEIATKAFIIQISHGPDTPPSEKRLSTLKRAYDLAGTSLKQLVEVTGTREADFPEGEKQFYFDCRGILDRTVAIVCGPKQPVWGGTIPILARKLGVYRTLFDSNASPPTE